MRSSVCIFQLHLHDCHRFWSIVARDVRRVAAGTPCRLTRGGVSTRHPSARAAQRLAAFRPEIVCIIQHCSSFSCCRWCSTPITINTNPTKWSGRRFLLPTTAANTHTQHVQSLQRRRSHDGRGSAEANFLGPN